MAFLEFPGCSTSFFDITKLIILILNFVKGKQYPNSWNVQTKLLAEILGNLPYMQSNEKLSVWHTNNISSTVSV